MPLLVYSYPAFTPNTVIQSAKVNAKFTDISTLLNTTGLDDTNIQSRRNYSRHEAQDRHGQLRAN
jgi:hypothetical protein